MHDFVQAVVKAANGHLAVAEKEDWSAGLKGAKTSKAAWKKAEQAARQTLLGEVQGGSLQVADTEMKSLSKQLNAFTERFEVVKILLDKAMKVVVETNDDYSSITSRAVLEANIFLAFKPS